MRAFDSMSEDDRLARLYHYCRNTGVDRYVFRNDTRSQSHSSEDGLRVIEICEYLGFTVSDAVTCEMIHSIVMKLKKFEESHSG